MTNETQYAVSDVDYEEAFGVHKVVRGGHFLDDGSFMSETNTAWRFAFEVDADENPVPPRRYAVSDCGLEEAFDESKLIREGFFRTDGRFQGLSTGCNKFGFQWKYAFEVDENDDLIEKKECKVKLTPCQEAGYKVGDKFRMGDFNHNMYSTGDILTLLRDDGTDCVSFTNGTADHHLFLYKVTPYSGTPCEEAGYKVGDEFLVTCKEDDNFKFGTVITLVLDDGSDLPKFKQGHREAFIYLSEVDPYSEPPVPVGDVSFESHPMYPVLMQVIEQAMFGKGERHGGCATPFLEQPWAHYAEMHGRGFLTGQAAKKLEEAASLRKGQAFNTEVFGAIAYLAMAVLNEDSTLED